MIGEAIGVSAVGAIGLDATAGLRFPNMLAILAQTPLCSAVCVGCCPSGAMSDMGILKHMGRIKVKK